MTKRTKALIFLAGFTAVAVVVGLAVVSLWISDAYSVPEKLTATASIVGIVFMLGGFALWLLAEES